jgi:hypothetical protein
MEAMYSALTKVGFVLIVAAIALCGQQSGSFTGTVLDPSGARVPIVKVELVLAGSEEVVATGRTGQDGRFLISAPGAQEYNLRLRSPGFKVAQVKVNMPSAAQVVDVGNIVIDVDRVIEDRVPIYGDGNPLVPLTWFPVVEPIEPIERSVCELSKNPARFLHVLVKLRTEVAHSGLDTGPGLFDHGCPEVLLGFGPANGAVTHDWSYRRLEEYLRQCRSVKATLMGRLELTLISGHEPTRGFRIESVSDMEAGLPWGIIRDKKGNQLNFCF